MKMAVFWVITLMMEAACTSETSVNFYQATPRNNPVDSHLYQRPSLRFPVSMYAVFLFYTFLL
jgi:hypothetical protein